MGKLRNLRSRITMVKAAWDEIAAMWQLIARGIVGYAPTVRTPPPKDLHMEDTAFYHFVLTALGSRQTADRSSFTATKTVGGLQLPNNLNAIVSGVAYEIMYRWFTDVSGLGLAEQARMLMYLRRQSERRSWPSTWRCGKTRCGGSRPIERSLSWRRCSRSTPSGP